jgi:hypothetical protein
VIAASTLLAAALFRPLHRRVQIRVDRRFDRRAYDAACIIDAFSHRLRDQVDLEQLVGELHDTVHQTMTPTTVTVWVSPDVPPLHPKLDRIVPLTQTGFVGTTRIRLRVQRVVATALLRKRCGSWSSVCGRPVRWSDPSRTLVT